MLVPTTYVSPTLLCKSHPLMLVPPSNVSHNGTNWKDAEHANIFLYLDSIVLSSYISSMEYSVPKIHFGNLVNNYLYQVLQGLS